MIDKLLKDLHNNFSENKVRLVEGAKQPTLEVDASILYELCSFLRDDKSCFFDFLANLTAVDYYPQNKFAVIYNLSSLPYQQQLTLRVELNMSNRNHDNLPVVPSVSSIWRTADWHEREAFDLMGIYFDGHPDLRRILLPDDWEGYPLRKDYEAADYYHGIKINGE